MPLYNLRPVALALAGLLVANGSPFARAQQADNAQSAAVSDAERKAKILESDCWRRAIFERNEWLRTQPVPPEEVARIKADFQARVERMSAVELEMVLADLQLKFQMLNTPEARDVRAWFGHYMSILASQRREEMLKSIPDLASINSQQLHQTLFWLAQQRNSRTQQQAQVRQLRSTATNPWKQQRPASRPTSSAGYRSPYRPQSFDRPFENTRLSGQGSLTIGPEGQVWRTFGLAQRDAALPMNKAFVREPDETGALLCPACGSLGVPVTRETWAAQVRDPAAGGLAESAFFCPFAKCRVVYFDMFERQLTTDELRHGVYPKDPQAPVCGCFGITLDEIEADARASIVERVRELLAKAKSDQAQCRTQAASGQPCIGEVQRAYMKAKSSGE